MPISIDDDTYLETINVGSNYSFDNGIEMDEEGEDMIEPQRMGARLSNYTANEDVLLCKTYLKVGMDASVGTDQTRDTYWFRMKEYFDKHNTSGNEHSDRSLRSRWSLINTDCQKWAAAMAQVDSMNPSGINDRDRLNMAQNLFRGVVKKNKKGKDVRVRDGPGPVSLRLCLGVK